MKISLEKVDALHFRLSPRGHIRFQPLRMWVDGQQLAIQGDEEHQAILGQLCKSADGFTARGLSQSLPGVDRDYLNQIIASMTEIGFLEFLDANN